MQMSIRHCPALPSAASGGSRPGAAIFSLSPLPLLRRSHKFRLWGEMRAAADCLTPLAKEGRRAKCVQTIRSATAVTERAATESVAPMLVRKAENPIKVDLRRFLLRTWDAIQASTSLSMSVERLAHQDRSVPGSSATWRGGTTWPASASAKCATDL